MNEKELIRKKILDSYIDFEDFQERYPDFHKLSEEAIASIQRLFTPITPNQIIKAIMGWVAVTITLIYLKEIFLLLLCVYGWIRGWDLFTKPISSLTVVELIVDIALCIMLLGIISTLYEILKSLVYGWYCWCFFISSEEQEEEWI